MHLWSNVILFSLKESCIIWCSTFTTHTSTPIVVLITTFCHTRSKLGISAQLEILLSCKLVQEVPIKCAYLTFMKAPRKVKFCGCLVSFLRLSRRCLINSCSVLWRFVGGVWRASKFVGQEFFQTKFLRTKIYVGGKFLWTKNFRPSFFGPTSFLLTPIFFWAKTFLDL